MVAVNEIFRECLAYSEEREWFEFKENSFDRDTVGEYISALSNSAAIIGRSFAFMFWGVNDKTHHVSGTKINLGKLPPAIFAVAIRKSLHPTESSAIVLVEIVFPGFSVYYIISQVHIE